MLLQSLKNWRPFQIDALGLVTMLGAAEVDKAVGRLVQSPFSDWLPLLGANTVPANQIVQPIPGFVLYNITDGVLATDLAGWFARWLLNQDLTFTSTTITILPTYPKHGYTAKSQAWVSAAVFGGTIMPLLIVLALVMGDWWGLANALSMLILVLVRQLVLDQNRKAIDIAVIEALKEEDQIVTSFITLPNGKAVSVFVPRQILVDCLLTTPRPPRDRLYQTARIVGWIAFGCHVICLGMATLFSQILAVAVLIVASVIVVYRLGDDETSIGSGLKLFLSRLDGEDRRSVAYAGLKLTEEEENSMMQWNLFPHKSNTLWWERYRRLQKDSILYSFKDLPLSDT